MRNDNATRVDEFFSPYCLKIYEVKEAGETRKKREAEKQRERQSERITYRYKLCYASLGEHSVASVDSWTAGQCNSLCSLLPASRISILQLPFVYATRIRKQSSLLFTPSQAKPTCCLLLHLQAKSSSTTCGCLPAAMEAAN